LRQLPLLAGDKVRYRSARHIGALELLTWMMNALTPPVPCVTTVLPFSKGSGPQNNVLIAVPAAPPNDAASTNDRWSGKDIKRLSA